MDKISKIALKIANSQITIRELLKKEINVNIIINTEDTIHLSFSGPVKLTPDGIARWGSTGILELNVLLDNNEAIINDVLSYKQIQNLCSLFNTISGNVNENTYNKYIDN